MENKILTVVKKILSSHAVGIRYCLRCRKLFRCQEFFPEISVIKIGVEINLRIITKNHGADLEKGFFTKSI